MEIDHPLLNGRPDALLYVTQNYNPGGGWGGVYNAHPVAVAYSPSRERWQILNEDGVAISQGASFNVYAPQRFAAADQRRAALWLHNFGVLGGVA